MVENYSTEVAKTAAQWWTKKISQNSLDNFRLSEEKGSCSLFLMFRRQIQASKFTPSQTQLDSFCKRLCSSIENRLKKSTSSEIRIDCEYSPCSLLEETADLVGINSCIFPVKRTMWIKHNSIRVQDGCGAAVDEIFHA